MSKKIDEVIKEYDDKRRKRFIKKVVIAALIIIIILICVFLGYKFYKRNNIWKTFIRVIYWQKNWPNLNKLVKKHGL